MIEIMIHWGQIIAKRAHAEKFGFEGGDKLIVTGGASANKGNYNPICYSNMSYMTINMFNNELSIVVYCIRYKNNPYTKRFTYYVWIKSEIIIKRNSAGDSRYFSIVGIHPIRNRKLSCNWSCKSCFIWEIAEPR